MSSRGGTLLIAFGSLVFLAGLCFVPAILKDQSDTGIVALGGCLISLGALFVAGGLFAKAQALKASVITDSPEVKQRRSGCELCATEAPVIFCKVHQLHLCGACLAQHYDFRSCSYVPSNRAASGKPGKAFGAAARA
jgi:hypothetical protein